MNTIGSEENTALHSSISKGVNSKLNSMGWQAVTILTQTGNDHCLLLGCCFFRVKQDFPGSQSAGCVDVAESNDTAFEWYQRIDFWGWTGYSACPFTQQPSLGRRGLADSQAPTILTYPQQGSICRPFVCFIKLRIKFSGHFRNILSKISTYSNLIFLGSQNNNDGSNSRLPGVWFTLPPCRSSRVSGRNSIGNSQLTDRQPSHKALFFVYLFFPRQSIGLLQIIGHHSFNLSASLFWKERFPCHFYALFFYTCRWGQNLFWKKREEKEGEEGERRTSKFRHFFSFLYSIQVYIFI